MKTFPLTYCVKTKDLTKESYSDLICLLVSQGYRNLTANLVTISLLQMWNYLGVTEHGDIVTYDHPFSFLKVNEWLEYPTCMRDEDYYNILTKEQLDKLLGEIK